MRDAAYGRISVASRSNSAATAKYRANFESKSPIQRTKKPSVFNAMSRRCASSGFGSRRPASS